MPFFEIIFDGIPIRLKHEGTKRRRTHTADTWRRQTQGRANQNYRRGGQERTTKERTNLAKAVLPGTNLPKARSGSVSNLRTKQSTARRIYTAPIHGLLRRTLPRHGGTVATKHRGGRKVLPHIFFYYSHMDVTEQRIPGRRRTRPCAWGIE